MNNIVIRKATYDYVCQVCGHIIRSGTEYLDRVILDHGKCVQHARYHDECPRDETMVQLAAKLVDGPLPVTCNTRIDYGTKYRVLGIVWNGTAKSVILQSWNKTAVYYVDMDRFEKEYGV